METDIVERESWAKFDPESCKASKLRLEEAEGDLRLAQDPTLPVDESKFTVKCRCHHCGSGFLHWMDVWYCPDRDCRREKDHLFSLAISGRVVCQRCGFVWKPRRGETPARCLKCRSVEWNVAITQRKVVVEPEKPTILCGVCGHQKPFDSVHCPWCGKQRSEVTHRLGLTLSQFSHQLYFLKNYDGDDPVILKICECVSQHIEAPIRPTRPVTPAAIKVETHPLPPPKDEDLSVEDQLRLLKTLPWNFAPLKDEEDAPEPPGEPIVSVPEEESEPQRLEAPQEAASGPASQP